MRRAGWRKTKSSTGQLNTFLLRKCLFYFSTHETARCGRRRTKKTSLCAREFIEASARVGNKLLQSRSRQCSRGGDRQPKITIETANSFCHMITTQPLNAMIFNSLYLRRFKLKNNPIGSEDDLCSFLASSQMGSVKSFFVRKICSTSAQMTAPEKAVESLYSKKLFLR